MAAPAATARGTPAGIKLQNGFRCLITFSHNTTISLWEMEVTPPGADGGDPIDTSTMHNATYRTKAPRALIELTNGQMKCAYDPAVKTQIMQEVNRKQTITVIYPDGTTDAEYGYLKSFTPDALVEGTMPTATCEFVSTAYDPTNNAEAGPTITSVSGT